MAEQKDEVLIAIQQLINLTLLSGSSSTPDVKWYNLEAETPEGSEYKIAYSLYDEDGVKGIDQHITITVNIKEITSIA